MFEKCFTCLDDNPVYPVIPKAVFTPNERTWVAENPDFFYGLEGIYRPRWGRRMPPPPWCPDPISRSGYGRTGFSGPWPKRYPPATTDFMRMRRPTFPPVELGEVERTPAQKVAAVVIGGALLVGLFWLAPRFTAVPERRRY